MGQQNIPVGDDASVQQLHDLATRGGVMTPAEQARLQEWYAQQDRQESRLLSPAPSAPDTLTQTRGEVAASLARIQAETRRLQTLAEENDALRRENDALARRLTQSASSQAA